MVNVFIVASKGIPAKYGGFETFVENLTGRKKSPNIKYFVSCMGTTEDEFEYNNSHCFSIPLRRQNPVFRILNVSSALTWVEKYIRKNKNKNEKNIVYILGCRVGLLMKKHKKALHKLNCLIMCNPDGLEWKRDKWNRFEKKILLLSEKNLLKNSDFIVCDSINIRKYILERYKFIIPEKSAFIAYGSDVANSIAKESDAVNWLNEKGTSLNDYYLVVGRFVPENNFELMIKEFMKSHTKKKLLIISNVEKNSFYETLSRNLNFEKDNRIVFAGTLYDSELIKKIRENAFAYLHGHSVGGTNPSLLEAMASTDINILYDVPFNREVANDQCLFFNGENGNLSNLIDEVDANRSFFAKKLHPKSIILNKYSWNNIVEQYEQLFLNLR